MNFASVIRMSAATRTVEMRVSQYDWSTLSEEINRYGCAVIEKLLSPEECRQIAGLYPEEGPFRSHIQMARHGFGKGEYRYFKYPLPDLIESLRTALYPHLANIANGWNERMGIDQRYPERHAEFLKAVSRPRSDAANAVAVAIRGGRLQLPASGSLRRPRIPAAGCNPAL
jgi:uncharacterized protein